MESKTGLHDRSSRPPLSGMSGTHGCAHREATGDRTRIGFDDVHLLVDDHSGWPNSLVLPGEPPAASRDRLDT